MGHTDSETSLMIYMYQVSWQRSRVWQTDGQTAKRVLWPEHTYSISCACKNCTDCFRS